LRAVRNSTISFHLDDQTDEGYRKRVECSFWLENGQPSKMTFRAKFAQEFFLQWCMSKLVDAMGARSSSRIAERKAAPVRKVKRENGSSVPSTPQPPATQPRVSDPAVRSQLEKGIFELLGLHDLLLTNEVDPNVMADFRDALNRVRNTAWAAQQYVVRKETDQDSTSVLSLLAGERIRTAYQLCQALSEDLTKTDLEFQRGSLVQLCEVTRTLTEQLKKIIDKLG
jgi:hypothetical protein